MFELLSDPTEHQLLKNATKIALLKEILAAHSANLFSPDRGAAVPAACAAAMGKYNGTWGPFIDLE